MIWEAKYLLKKYLDPTVNIYIILCLTIFIQIYRYMNSQTSWPLCLDFVSSSFRTGCSYRATTWPNPFATAAMLASLITFQHLHVYTPSSGMTRRVSSWNASKMVCEDTLLVSITFYFHKFVCLIVWFDNDMGFCMGIQISEAFSEA